MAERNTILAAQLRAGRALVKMEQQTLCDRSGVSIATLRRMEAGDGPVRGNYGNVAAVVAALEAAGVEFTNGSQPGVRLRSPTADKAIPPDELTAENDG